MSIVLLLLLAVTGFAAEPTAPPVNCPIDGVDVEGDFSPTLGPEAHLAWFEARQAAGGIQGAGEILSSMRTHHPDHPCTQLALVRQAAVVEARTTSVGTEVILTMAGPSAEDEMRFTVLEAGGTRLRQHTCDCAPGRTIELVFTDEAMASGAGPLGIAQRNHHALGEDPDRAEGPWRLTFHETSPPFLLSQDLADAVASRAPIEVEFFGTTLSLGHQRTERDERTGLDVATYGNHLGEVLVVIQGTRVVLRIATLLDRHHTILKSVQPAGTARSQ